MKQIPKISDAEWVVMKVFWEASPKTANQVVEALQHTGWSPTTIRTLINRLHKKGALHYEKQGREFCYSPQVKETACVSQEAQSLIKRTGRAVLKPMLASFLEAEAFSPEEIEALKQILATKAADPEQGAS